MEVWQPDQAEHDVFKRLHGINKS